MGGGVNDRIFVYKIDRIIKIDLMAEKQVA